MSNATNVAVLRVEAQDRRVRYTLSLAGGATGLPVEVAGEVSWSQEETAPPPRPGASQAGDVAFGYRARLAPPPLPDAVERRLRQWALSCPGGGTLCVQCEGDKDGKLGELAWEELRASLALDGTVVVRLAGAGAPRPRWMEDQRRSSGMSPGATMRGGDPGYSGGPGRSAASPDSAPVLLIAGWPRHRGRTLPGIHRELTDLAAGLGQAQVTAVAFSEPTAEELRAACQQRAPAVLHLAHPGVGRDGAPRLSVPLDAGGMAALGAEELLGDLGPTMPALVVVNASAGSAIARALSERLGVIALGWDGSIGDEEAADFSFFFYQRLLEGLTVVDVVEAYRRRHEEGRGALGAGAARRARGSPQPLLWLPVVEAAGWSLPRGGHGADVVFRGSGASGVRGSVLRGGARAAEEVWRSAGGAGGVGSDLVQIELTPAAAINPALLLNGRPALLRLSVDCPRPIIRARLRVECDTGAGASVHRQTMNLDGGVNSLDVGTVQFPALYELMQQGMSRRYVSFSVRLSEEDRLLAEATDTALWMGPNEWMDQPETWAFIPAFVQPICAGVKEVLDKAVEQLSVIAGTEATYSGYQGGSVDSVKLQVRGLFQTLRHKPFELAYINPPAGSIYTPDSGRPVGQRVRLADEVIEHRRGTCHDLALLFASCLEHVGIHPLVILKPGHTFFGFWTSALGHSRFWSGRPEARSVGSGGGFGEGWMLREATELERLVAAGDIDVVEATDVTKRGVSYEQACSTGKAHVREMLRGRLDAAVDVCRARRMVQPI